MKRFFATVLLFLFIFPLSASARDTAELLAEADRLSAQGTRDYTADNTPEYFFQAMELSCQAATQSPESFEANWKAARDCRLYTLLIKLNLLPGWEKLTARYGKQGMNFGARATELEPEAIEGHFWYGCCVGSYSDGVSIVTAVKEGLVGKTRSSFEAAYDLDKSYWSCCPQLSLGELWYVLPWPLAKKDKSRKYLEEFVSSAPQGPYLLEGQLYLGKLLADGKGKDKARGKELLETVAACDYPFMKDMARATLKKKF